MSTKIHLLTTTANDNNVVNFIGCDHGSGGYPVRQDCVVKIHLDWAKDMLSSLREKIKDYREDIEYFPYELVVFLWGDDLRKSVYSGKGEVFRALVQLVELDVADPLKPVSKAIETIRIEGKASTLKSKNPTYIRLI